MVTTWVTVIRNEAAPKTMRFQTERFIYSMGVYRSCSIVHVQLTVQFARFHWIELHTAWYMNWTHKHNVTIFTNQRFYTLAGINLTFIADYARTADVVEELLSIFFISEFTVHHVRFTIQSPVVNHILFNVGCLFCINITGNVLCLSLHRML